MHSATPRMRKFFVNLLLSYIHHCATLWALITQHRMKVKVGIEKPKEEEPSALPLPVSQPLPAQHVTVVQPEPRKQPGSTCWFVWSILATIFCCLPCGAIGLAHAMIAKHEGERGNFIGHKRRLYQAKCWTSWSIGLGVASLILIGVMMGLACTRRSSSRWYVEDAYPLKDYVGYSTTDSVGPYGKHGNKGDGEGDFDHHPTGEDYNEFDGHTGDGGVGKDDDRQEDSDGHRGPGGHMEVTEVLGSWRSQGSWGSWRSQRSWGSWRS
ncbi:hypothetical protein EB796_014748 [Bugula neritina]|uniref:Uncharacterized protein n=1 Tax=Bugula neritina TaxID=10212 RepID=A0A7J7JMX6_BUGNE|nr:hypothetical protein EB796_014748 [Bugula neritina]